MPITINPVNPTLPIGPGLPVQIQSDFIGPLPSGSQWFISVARDSEFEHLVFTDHFNADGAFFEYTPLPAHNRSHINPEEWIAEGANAHWQVILQDGEGATIDEDVGTQPWSNTEGLWHLLSSLGSTGGGVQLTPTQSAQIAATDSRTEAVLGDFAPTITDAEGAHTFTLGELFTGKALDQLTLTEVSPGPTSDPVTSDVGTFLFGVIVRITSLPANAIPLTPAEDWYPQDLAVLRVFRGTDIEERYGIHTVSFMHPFHNLYGGVVLNETLLFGTPPLTSIEVEFAFGAAGQVFLMRFP